MSVAVSYFKLPVYFRRYRGLGLPLPVRFDTRHFVEDVGHEPRAVTHSTAYMCRQNFPRGN